MGSSLPFFSPYVLPKKSYLNNSLLAPWNPFSVSRIAKHKKFCSLIPCNERNLENSWISSESSSNDEFSGWSIRKPEIEERNDIPKFVLLGLGTSMAIAIAAFSYFSFSNKGFKFHLDVPFNSIHELLMPSESKKIPAEVTEPTALEIKQALETRTDNKHELPSDVMKPKENRIPVLGENKRIVVQIAADPTQQEALCVLKRLKIIDNDASDNELCTRREYARWFVRANSMLERNPKHRIVPINVIAGSMVTAFDDVSANDPDFLWIQALGETGIVPSKLSTMNFQISDLNSSDSQERCDFCPESFISRFDLVNWKTMLEYSFTSEMREKMSRTKAGLLDLSATTLDASPQLVTDLMAGDKSIIRRVFGNIRRLQPQKPVTKAQAAVALTSGRNTEAICSELSRLEAEKQSRLAEIEEIRSELIRRGEIQRFWDERLDKEKDRGLEVERAFEVALLNLEEEKVAQAVLHAVYMKEKAALDCQQQLLLGLRQEVDGMCDRLANERTNFLAEQKSLEKQFADLRDQQDAIIEAKSILEAEKEALRILRYWVEEEAQRIQARAKNLEQAAQRWRWNGDSGELA